MKPEGIEEILNKLGAEDVPADVHKIAEEASANFSETLMRPRQHILWSDIMKSPITKLAAAAAIIIAVFVVIHQVDESSIAFADVVRTLVTARTATFKVTVKIQDRPSVCYEGWFMEPAYSRLIMPGGVIQIADMTQGKIVTLLTARKKARISNIPPKQSKSGLFEIRRLIQEAQKHKDESVEFLGRQQIDGQSAVGYRVREDRQDVTIWANTKTLLPIRIESITTSEPNRQGTVTMTDFVFDVELDKSLLDLEIPEGYTVVEQFDANDFDNLDR